MGGFVKTVLPSSVGYDSDVPLASLVDVHSQGVDTQWMHKHAAAGVFKDVDIKPEKGYAHIHLIAMGDGENYGCFFAGAPVQTIDGIKAIEDIKEGELVLTHKNRYKPTTTTYAQPYTGNAVRLRILGMAEDVECTANHPFRVVRKAGLSPATQTHMRQAGTLMSELERRAQDAEWVSAEDIQPGDYIVSTLNPENSDGTELPPEFDPYVAGFYLAEGCLVKEYKDISTKGEYSGVMLTGAISDDATWDYIDSWLESLGRTPVVRSTSYTSELGVRYAFGFKDIAQLFDRLFGHTAHTKHIHPVMWALSREDKLKFLAGYFDGDGCLHTTQDNRYHGTLTASTESFGLAQDIQRLLASVGVQSSINKGTNKVSNGCFGHKDFPIYSISVGAFHSNVILEHTLRMRPHTRQFKHGATGASLRIAENHILFKVAEVTKYEVEATIKYNIEVEDDHSYVVMSQHVKNSNRNGDRFDKQAHAIAIPNPKPGTPDIVKINKGNKETYDTFEKYAKVYLNHDNKDPKNAKGDVIKAAHNENMARVELIIKVPEDEWGNDLEKLASGDDVAFSMSCFPAGAPVRMWDGSEKLIETLIEGDEVLTHEGNKGLVIARMSRDYDDMGVTLRATGAPDPVTMTADHEVWIRPAAGHINTCPVCGQTFKSIRAHLWQQRDEAHTRAYEDVSRAAEGWLRADSILVGDFVRTPIPTAVGADISRDLAVIAGYYLAKGWAGITQTFHGKYTYDTPRAEFTFHIDEKEYTDELMNAIVGAGFNTPSLVLVPDKNTRIVKSFDPGLCDWLIANCGRLSHHKALSPELLCLPPATQKVILEKWLEGDGGWDKIHECIAGSTVSRQMALDLSDIAARCAIPVKLTKRTGWHFEIFTLEFASHVTGNLNVSKIPVGWEYATSTTARDLGRLQPWQEGMVAEQEYRPQLWMYIEGNYIYRRVYKCEYTQLSERVYDVTVLDDHGFVVSGVGVSNCTVPYDVCSECGNKASNRGQYCNHLTNHMGAITKQGNQICAVNDHMRYFDISKVVVPADRIAFGLLKAASSAARVVSGAELAERFNIVAPDLMATKDLTLDKLAALRKLSEIEKEIEAVAEGSSPINHECKAMNPDVFVRDMDSDAMEPMSEMRRIEIPALLGNLADKKIMLSLKDFIKLLVGSKFGDVSNFMPEAQDLMPGVFGRMMKSPCRMLSDSGSMDLEGGVLPRAVRDMIQDMAPAKSLDTDPVQRRATITVIRGGGPAMKVVKASSFSHIHTGASPVAERLAQAYAMYKLAFCQRVGENDNVWTRAVLHDYIK